MKLSYYLATGITAAASSLALATMDTLPVPPRPADAKTGSQFYAQVTSLSLAAREDAIFTEITSGNIPDFMRTLKPVNVSGSAGGKTHTVRYYVTPDYLCVGSDADFFRMPMTPGLAQWLADHFQCVLPERKMVNDIYTAASVKLAPSPISPSAEMITVPVFWQHNQMVEAQRAAAGAPLGALIGGIKKDVVITPLIYTQSSPARVAIYGWHKLDGSPIQPLYLGHESTYADYSHGIRLVNSEMLLDGATTTVQSVLADPVLCVLLSDEGVNTKPRYPASAPPGTFPYFDHFTSAGRELATWADRFTVPVVVAFSPSSPGGDGYALRVRDSSGGIDSTRTGRVSDKDYYVECDIYCRYRPEIASDGYERVGIFARDDGNGMFEGTSGAGVKGNNYSLTWDSNNGRIQCLRTLAGSAVDLLPAPVYNPSSAWRRMRIETVGNQITFKVDGAVLRSVTDTAFSAGQFGIGYHEYFTTNGNILGTYADNFSADRLPPSRVGAWQGY